MEFVGAAEHLLLQRQGRTSIPDEIHYGWPLEVHEVPLLPARPQGWLAQPSGLSQWVALRVHVTKYLGAIKREREWRMHSGAERRSSASVRRFCACPRSYRRAIARKPA